MRIRKHRQNRLDIVYFLFRIGFPHRRIAQMLNHSLSTICNDMRHLRRLRPDDEILHAPKSFQNLLGAAIDQQEVQPPHRYFIKDFKALLLAELFSPSLRKKIDLISAALPYLWPPPPKSNPSLLLVEAALGPIHRVLTVEEFWSHYVKCLRNNSIKTPSDRKSFEEDFLRKFVEHHRRQLYSTDWDFFRAITQQVIKTLSPREEEILVVLFGLNDKPKQTIESLAAQLGVSRQKIQQIRSKALRKLRHHSRAKILYHGLSARPTRQDASALVSIQI